MKERKQPVHGDPSLVQQWLFNWVRDNKYEPEFLKHCHMLAKTAMEDSRDHGNEPPACWDAEGITTDFLLMLFNDKKVRIRTKAALKVEFGRFYRETVFPADTALWEIVSKALRELAKKGKIRRIGEELTKNNHNGSIYTISGPDQDSTLCHFDVLMELPVAQVENQKRRSNYTEKNTHQQLTLSEAEKLLIETLILADQPCRLGDLVQFVRTKVEIAVPRPKKPTAGDPPGPGDEPAIEPQSLDDMSWSDHSFKRQVEKLAEELRNTQNGPELLFGYLWRNKAMKDNSIEHSSFGVAPQTNSTRVKKIEAILKRNLLNSRFDPAFLKQILMELAKIFPEEAQSSGFNDDMGRDLKHLR